MPSESAPPILGPRPGSFAHLRARFRETTWAAPLREEHAILASKKGAALAIPVAVVLALVVESPWGLRTTGVVPGAVYVATLAFVLEVVAVSFLVSYERYVASAPVRALDALVTVAYCCVFGAASTLDVSPGYAFALPVAVNHAIMLVHRRPWLLVTSGLVPLAMRVLVVPDPSTESLVAALVVGALTSASTLLLGLRHEREHALRLAFEEAAAHVAERRRSIRGLLAAMSLHDGLSGAVLVLEAKLAEAARYEDVRAAVRGIVDRSRALAAGTGPRTLDALRDELPTVAAWLGHRCDVTVDPAADALPAAERRDVAELAWEAAMNAVRRRRDAHVVLRVSIDEDVRITCRVGAEGDEAPAPAGTGRGLRYASMRAMRRGGDAGLEPDGTFVARWPRSPSPPLAGRALALASLVGIAGPAVLVAELTQERAAIWLGVAGALGASSAYAAMGDDAAALRARLDALDAESLALDEQASRSTVRALLDDAALGLLAADAAADIDAARRAARALAEAVGRALEALEADDALRAALTR